MFITINGASLNYSIAGDHHEQTFVVLHGGRGLGSHPEVFKAFLPLANTYRLIGYDMRGHGESSLTKPYTFDQLSDDLEGIRKTLGRDRPMILLGGSFGGMMALSYAVRYPHGLSHLILRGTAPSWRHELEALANFEARAAKAPMLTKSMLHKEFSDGIIDDNEFRLIWFAMAPLYIADGARIDYDAILEATRRTPIRTETHNALFKAENGPGGKAYDVTDRLREIKVPTFVMCGEQDWICPPSQSKLIVSSIPGAKLFMVPNSNHGVPPAIAVQEVRRFLESTSGHPLAAGIYKRRPVC